MVLEHLQYSRVNGDFISDLFPKCLLNAYYVLGEMKDWLFMYLFI